jgi:hypothetical protein
MPQDNSRRNLKDSGRDIAADARAGRAVGLDSAVRLAERYKDTRTASEARRMINAGGRMSPPPGYFARREKRARRTSNGR